MFEQQCWKGGQSIKHCLTSKVKQNLWRDVFEKVQNIFCLMQAKMLDEQFFDVPNRQTFYLTSKFQIFDQQCLIV